MLQYFEISGDTRVWQVRIRNDCVERHQDLYGLSVDFGHGLDGLGLEGRQQSPRRGEILLSHGCSHPAHSSFPREPEAEAGP